MKFQRKVEIYLLIISILLAIIAGLLLFQIVFEPLLRSFFAIQSQKEEELKQSREILKELSRLEFSIKGFYYLNSILPSDIKELDEQTKYSYRIEYEDRGESYDVRLRGNMPLLSNRKLMEEFNLTGKIYSTKDGFLYLFNIKKVY
ncbi:hypothetical protein [Kosmotoga pacifica]|uniref:Type II secretion system protein GspG C-terminal domain-containing protein n=1 Tax=Kosmotoga pacifica TaxID=1330330 RepID=A0A0G2ZEE7_9BACT|nr:hypothetical protein [Kosmotoga pacifica]AKI97233.1 hypothetical protein IX53_04740 [Kosmotoga pacifica]